MPRQLLAIALLCGVTALTACGGNAEDPKTPASKDAKALGPMEELKGIPGELDAEVAALTKPVDDLQSAMDELGALPKKHGLAAADVMGMAKGTFDHGKVEMNFKGDVSADAKADVEASLKKLNGAVLALKATPDKVASLTTKAVSLTAKVPVLAGKVTASATVSASNPFGSADSKAKATADLEGVKKVQADVMTSISGMQTKITGLPAMATTALAKASASFAGGT